MKGCKNCKLNPSCTMVWRTSKKDCPHFIQKTNADRIRAMSDEELIQFQAALIKTLGCPPSNPEVCIDDCKKCWGIYLRQPLEEET